MTRRPEWPPASLGYSWVDAASKAANLDRGQEGVPEHAGRLKERL